MEMFDINYMEATTKLLKESFTFKKYKAMGPLSAVLCGLIVLPFVVFSFAVAAMLYLVSFFYSVMISPLHYFYNVVHKEGQDVKHGTQVVVYLISWPIISLLYLSISFTMAWLTVLYALFSCLTYIWSFGGFVFHLFVKDAENISITVDKKYSKKLVVFFIVIALIILLVVPVIRVIAEVIDMYAGDITLDLLSGLFKAFFVESFTWNLLFVVLYSLIGLCPRPASKKEETAVTE